MTDFRIATGQRIEDRFFDGTMLTTGYAGRRVGTVYAEFRDESGSTDSKHWRMAFSSGSMAIVTADDANVATAEGYVITRSGNAVTQHEFKVGGTTKLTVDSNGVTLADGPLAAIAALSAADGNIIVGDGSTWVAESGATARTSLGLGSMATQAADAVVITGGSVTGATVRHEGLPVYYDQDEDTYLYTATDDLLDWVVGGTTMMRLGTGYGLALLNGNWLQIGDLTAAGSGQIRITSASGTDIMSERYANDAFNATHVFRKSRSTTPGSFVALQSGDGVGGTTWAGDDGGAFRIMAGFTANVDGTPSSPRVPGRFVWSLASASAGISEKMRLSSNGNLLVGGTAEAASAVKSLHLFNGTAPSAGVADGVVWYSADVSASAVAHVKNESGDVIILDQQATLTSADAGTVNTGDATSDGVIDNIRTRLGELETRLTAMGILAA